MLDIASDEEKEKKLDIIVRIRKYMNEFGDNQSIVCIVGNNKQQLVQFQVSLHKKSLADLLLILQTIEFELLLSKSTTLIPETIKKAVQIGEGLASLSGINFVGGFEELTQDDDFKFYLQMYSCSSSLLPKPKHILGVKIMQMYYQKYLNNKTGAKPDKFNFDDIKSKLELIKSQQKSTIPSE